MKLKGRHHEYHYHESILDEIAQEVKNGRYVPLGVFIKGQCGEHRDNRLDSYFEIFFNTFKEYYYCNNSISVRVNGTCSNRGEPHAYLSTGLGWVCHFPSLLKQISSGLSLLPVFCKSKELLKYRLKESVSPSYGLFKTEGGLWDWPTIVNLSSRGEIMSKMTLSRKKANVLTLEKICMLCQRLEHCAPTYVEIISTKIPQDNLRKS